VIDSPYLTADEAFRYLRFASRAALYKAIPVEGIPTLRRGRTLLFNRDALDRWLAGTPTLQLMAAARARKERSV
jgi:excisionase family DNA binding protein